MFEVQGHTIRISQGDTGVVTFRVEGVTLSEADRAVFTVRGGCAGVLKKVVAPQDGGFCVPLASGETQAMPPGLYSWDLRIVLEAKVDGQGAVTDGREVITPWLPGRFEVMKVVGRI